MFKALSVDLRVRVLSAVVAGAMHRVAVGRFCVTAASVSRGRGASAWRLTGVMCLKFLSHRADTRSSPPPSSQPFAVTLKNLDKSVYCAL